MWEELRKVYEEDRMFEEVFKVEDNGKGERRGRQK